MRATRRWVGLALACAMVALWEAPALAHATFPGAQNPLGSAAAPYPGDSAQYVVLRVPEERAGPPKLDNVNVKVEVPAGWSNPACQDALTAAGSVPGPVAGGWSCMVDAGSPTVIHWTRAASASGIGVYFPFFVSTPAAAATYAFVVHQTYSNGEVVDWKDLPVPPGCTTGINEAGTACTLPAPRLVVGSPAAKGYWLVASDGGVFAFGAAAFYGSTGALTLNKPIVGMAATPSGKGYWLVASDGGVFAFGDATFLGSTGAVTLNKPMVGMAATPSGKGYWLVASDGGIFAFGDAPFAGSTGALKLNKPIVGMATTPFGKGYWLVASDGGIFAFGDALFFGSTGAITLNKPIAGMAATPSGRGYWLVASDGGIFSFGNAAFKGSGANASGAPVVGMGLTPSGNGYWFASSAGVVQNQGDATALGSTPALNRPVVGLATRR